MKVVGIIAEYNPFHFGHEYQIRYAKETLGADHVVIVMSGNFVQRGTPALLEKHERARMALSGGADLVLELPVMWATASAERFARGGVELLNDLGIVDHLCFGCECGSSADFLRIADILVKEPAEFRIGLQNGLKQGLSYPEARALSLKTYLQNKRNLRRSFLLHTQANQNSGPFLDRSEDHSERLWELLNSPNNILGVEYCKALLELSSPIQPEPLLRDGSPYHGKSLEPDQSPSALAIRELVAQTVTAESENSTPDGCHPKNSFAGPDLHFWMNAGSIQILQENLKKQRFLFENSLDLPLHYALLCAIHQKKLRSFQDMTPKLSNRIEKTIGNYQSFSRYVNLLKTKEITQTHIQRALLHIFLGITEIPDAVPYARILGFRKSSEELLHQIKRHSAVPLISKPASADRLLNPDALSVFQTDVYTSNLYESLLLSQKQASFERNFIHEFQKSPVIV